MAFGATKQPTQKKRPFNINDVETSTNQENIPVPYIAGVAKCAVDWIAPIYNKTSQKADTGAAKEKGGSGASQQKKWYGDIAGITNVCPDDAPNDAILYILVNDEIALKGPLSRAPGTHYVAFSIPKFSQACRFYWGTKDQPIDDLILSPRTTALPAGGNPRDPDTWDPETPGARATYNGQIAGKANSKSGHYDFHPAYRNQGLFVSRQFFLGSSPNVPNVIIILARGTKFFAGARFEAAEAGVNPMGPKYEVLTDDLFGCGIPEARLVTQTFQDTATALTNENVLLAPALRQSAVARTFFADYFQYYDGFFRRNGSLIEAGHFSHGDVDRALLPDLGSDDLVAEPSIKPGDLAATKNTFFVSYTNREKWYKDDDTDRYVDHANYYKVGRKREERLQRPYIIDGAQAVRHAVEWGKIFAIEPVTGSAAFAQNRIGTLRHGDRFKTDIESLSLSFVWRIIAVEVSSDRDGTAKFTIENERGIGPVAFTQPPAPRPQDFQVKAVAIANARIVELPSGDLKTIAATQIAILAQRPSADILGFKVYISSDNGTTYDPVGAQTHFATFGRIASLAYSAGTADVDTATGALIDLFGVDLENVAAASQSDGQRDDRNLLCFVDNEIMAVGAVQSTGSGRYRIFFRRALYGTAKAAHAIDANCWFIPRAFVEPLDNRNFVAAGTRFFKLVPYIFGGDYDIGQVTPIQYTFGSVPSVNAVSNLQLTTDSVSTADKKVDARISATWSFVADQDIASFEVGLKRSSDSDWQTRNVGGTPATTWSGLSPSTYYDVRVRPVNSAGEPGLWCTPANIFSASGPIPGPPTALTAQTAQRGVVLEWINSTDSGIAKIQILASTTNDVATASVVGSVAYPGTTFVHSALPGGARYYYWVRSVDNLGRASNVFPAGNGVSVLVGDVEATSVADFSVTATKMFQRVIILQGDVWTDNSPAAGSIAWNAHQLVYNGAAYNIAAGNTTGQFVYWKPSVSTTVYQTSTTLPTLGDGDFMIATNADLNRDGAGDGLHDLAWNAQANAVIGTAHIIRAAITDALIANLSADKIDTGTLNAARIAAGSIVLGKLGSDVTPANLGADPAGAADAIKIGGRNFVRKNVYAVADGTGASGFSYVSINYLPLSLPPLKQNQPYSISFIAWAPGNMVLSVDLYPDDLPEMNFNITPTPTRYKWEGITSPSGNMPTATLRFFRYGTSNFSLADIQLEEGNKATSWTPSPLDQTSDAQSMATAADQSARAASLLRESYLVSGTTEINGGTIYTGSISAAKIDANAILTNTVQSNNFVAGSQGWDINRNGDAEFNRITLRNGVQINTHDDLYLTPSSSFTDSLAITVGGSAGSNATIYTTDGSEPIYGTDPQVGAITVTNTTTIKIKSFFVQGGVIVWESRSVSATYTKVPPNDSALPSCTVPNFARTSGTWGSTAVYGTLVCSTAGATIWISDDGSNFYAYTGGTIGIGLNYEKHIYATAAGFRPSGTNDYYNNAASPGGGRYPQ